MKLKLNYFILLFLFGSCSPKVVVKSPRLAATEIRHPKSEILLRGYHFIRKNPNFTQN
jgi:hypothetical protein